MTFDQKTKMYEFIGHSGAITALSISYDSKYFISGSSDNQIRLWDILSQTCLSIYKGHVKTILKLIISPKGFFFASTCADTLLYLWCTNS